jgi:hypothetical protein
MYPAGIAGAEGLTVHAFSTGIEIKASDASRARADRLERLLVLGMVAATAIQAALFAWFWLA